MLSSLELDGARALKQPRFQQTLARPFPLGAADSAFPAPGLLQLLLPLETNISCCYVCLSPKRLSMNLSHCLFTCSVPKAPELLSGVLKVSRPYAGEGH